MTYRILSCVAWVAFLLGPVGSASRAADDVGSFAAHLAALLNEGWENPSASLGAIDRHYARLTAADPRDSRAEYAVALVHLKHRRLAEGKMSLEAAVKKNKADLPAWQALFWVMMSQREHEAALAKMVSLAVIYPNRVVAEEVETSLRETAECMGRLCGFLAGPGKNTVPPELLDTTEQKITARLDSERRKAFDAGRQKVLDQFEKTKEQIAETREDDKAEAEQEKADRGEKLKRDRERVLADISRLDAELGASRTEMDKEVGLLDKRIAPLQVQYDQINRQMQPVRNRLLDLQRQQDRIRSDASRAKENRERDRLNREADQLRSRFSNEERYLRPLEDQLSRVGAEGTQLQIQRNQILGRFQAKATGINAELQNLRRSEKLMDRVERVLEKPATGDSARAAGMQAKLTALATYQKLALDAERQRLLDGAR